MGSAGCHNKSQINETGAGVKWKRLIQVLWPGRMVDPCLKHNPPFLLKCSSYRDREGRNFFSYLINIAIIWQVLSMHLYSFWYVRVLSNYLSSFWLAHCKNLPLCHLGQWRRLPSTPWLSRVSGPVGGVLQDSQSESQELLQPSNSSLCWTWYPHIHGNQLESVEHPWILTQPCPLCSPCVTCPSKVPRWPYSPCWQLPMLQLSMFTEGKEKGKQSLSTENSSNFGKEMSINFHESQMIQIGWTQKGLLIIPKLSKSKTKRILKAAIKSDSSHTRESL